MKQKRSRLTDIENKLVVTSGEREAWRGKIAVGERKGLLGDCIKSCVWGFPGGAVVENLPANAGDTGSSPGLGRSHMPWSN